MNQATNKIPYGLLTEEEQARFCIDAKTRGMYEYFNYQGEWRILTGHLFSLDYAYRLKMVEGEIYYCETASHKWIFKSHIGEYPTTYSEAWCISSGKTYSDYRHLGVIRTLRPATANESVKFNKALEPEELIVPEEAALLNIPNTTNPDCPTYMVSEGKFKEGVDKRLPEKEPTMLSNGYPELDRKNPVAAPMKKCPKCRATMFLDTTGNWCCSFVGDQRQGIAGCDYFEERIPAKESPSADWKKGYSMGVHDRGLESEAKLKDEIITKMMDHLREEVKK